MNDKNKELLFINHDIKNYIASSITYLELTKIQNPELSDLENIGLVLDNLHRGIELTNEVSLRIDCNLDEVPNNHNDDIVKIEANIHIEDIVKPVYEDLRKRTNLILNDTYELTNTEKHLMFNYVLVARFRENVITNAMKAGATRLDIHHKLLDKYAVITYTDDGKGMSQEEIDKITLSMHGDGKIDGVGTRGIFDAAEQIGFYVTYLSIIGEGTTVRVLYPYTNV